MRNLIKDYLDEERFIARTNEEIFAEIARLEGDDVVLSLKKYFNEKSHCAENDAHYAVVGYRVNGISIYDYFKAQIREMVEKTLAFLLDKKYVEKGRRILDVGCGTGLETVFFSQVTEQEGFVLGVDRSKEMLEAAVSRTKDRILKPQFAAGDREKLPVGNESVDTVICINSLLEGDCYQFPHGEIYMNWDINARLAEFSRVLRVGGRLLLSTQLRNLWCLDYESERMRSILSSKGFVPEISNFSYTDRAGEETCYFLVGGEKTESVSKLHAVLEPCSLNPAKT